MKLLDLELACAQWPTQSDAKVSSPGQIIGTADFIAPEQISDSRAVDIRSDIHSLGCTLFTLLAGRPPFSGPAYPTAVEKLYAHAHVPIPPVKELCPDVPDALETILGRMVAKLPDERYPIPSHVAEAITPLCDGANLMALVTSTGARSVSTATAGRGEPKRRALLRKLLLGMAAFLTLIVVGSIVAAYWPKTPGPDVAAPPTVADLTSPAAAIRGTV
jgi:serine/threonine protein kinase